MRRFRPLRTSASFKRQDHEKSERNATTCKRHSAWDWRKGIPVPEKKRNLGPTKAEKSREKYACIECLKLSLLGKRDEKFASLCRNDTSSIKRHKERWHKEAESSKCTIVPSNAPEIQSLRDQYSNSKASRITNTSEEKPLNVVLIPSKSSLLLFPLKSRAGVAQKRISSFSPRKKNVNIIPNQVNQQHQ